MLNSYEEFMFGQGILERIGLLRTGTGVLGLCDVNETIISINNLKSFDGLTIIISFIQKNLFPILTGAHSQTEASARSWLKPRGVVLLQL